MRTALIAFGIVLALLAGGVFWAMSSAEDVLHETIQTVGSQAVGAAVRVGRSEVDLVTGRIALFEVSVAHPPGYGDGTAIEAARVEILMDRDNDEGHILVLSRVVASGVRVAMDRRDGGSNVAALLANTASYAALPPPRPTSSEASEEGLSARPAPRFRIHDLYIRDGDVTVGPAPARPLGDIHLSGLGGETGKTAVALLQPVLEALLAAAERAAAASG